MMSVYPRQRLYRFPFSRRIVGLARFVQTLHDDSLCWGLHFHVSLGDRHDMKDHWEIGKLKQCFIFDYHENYVCESVSDRQDLWM